MAVLQLRWRWLFFILFLQKSIEAFVLEGSPTSYAQFKRWYAGMTDSLSFEFKTTEPNGLLLYLDDGGIGDFFELKLVDGTIRFRFNLGGGAMLTHAGVNLHDDQWHRVELIRSIEDTILKVDEDTQSKVTKGTDYHFGNYSSNSFVYIGGIPSWYSAKLTQMSLPSVFFEPHFKGSIRSVVYASEEGPHRQQDMVEFKGIRSNELDACEHHDPCQHNGVCISTDSGAICDCGTGDYDGNFCEKGSVSELCRQFQTAASLFEQKEGIVCECIGFFRRSIIFYPRKETPSLHWNRSSFSAFSNDVSCHISVELNEKGDRVSFPDRKVEKEIQCVFSVHLLLWGTACPLTDPLDVSIFN